MDGRLLTCYLVDFFLEAAGFLATVLGFFETDFLTWASLFTSSDFFSIFFVPKTKTKWLERFLIGLAEPMARGIKRFSVMPLLTEISFINKSFESASKFFSALEIAD